MTKEDEAALFARVEKLPAASYPDVVSIFTGETLIDNADLRALLALARGNGEDEKARKLVATLTGGMTNWSEQKVRRPPSPPSPSPWPPEDAVERAKTAYLTTWVAHRQVENTDPSDVALRAALIAAGPPVNANGMNPDLEPTDERS
jgi:hypothetical protein